MPRKSAATSGRASAPPEVGKKTPPPPFRKITKGEAKALGITPEGATPPPAPEVQAIVAVAKSAVPGEYYVYEAPDAVTFQAMANRLRAAFTYLKKPWPRICKVTVNGRAAAGVLILRRKVSLEQYPQQPLATQPPKPPAKADR